MISPSYSHVQESPLYLILFGSSIPFFVGAWLAREQPVVVAVRSDPDCCWPSSGWPSIT